MTAPDGASVPLERIARAEASACRLTTPCGDGEMVWRLWGEGPPLVLLHGNFGSWMHWIRNVEALSRFYTVMVPDTPGFGESPLPPSVETPRAIAAVTAQGLVEIAPPDEQIRVVGFSYGGRLAGEIAALLQDRVAAMVGVAPAGLGIDDSTRPGLAKMRVHMTPEEIAEVHRHNLALLMFADADAADDLAVHIQETNTRRAKFRLTAWSEEDRRSSLAKVLPSVRAPVMGIWSDRDAFAGDMLQQRFDIVRKLKPDADIRTLKGAGHWMQYEAPERFNALLLDLLEAGSAAGAP
jgi:pimeloyl-ACP methyl ester carboxylesterase